MASTANSPQWFTTAVTDSHYPLNKKNSLVDYSSGPLAKMVDMAPRKRHHNQRPVKFSDDAAQVHQLESHDEDPATLWFSKQEIQGLRDQGRQTLKKVEEAGGDLSTLDESMGESIRGLEHGLSGEATDDAVWDGDTHVGRRQRTKNIVSTILAQQEEQKDMGISDPKGLQQCSLACTQWAHDRALDLAKKDFDEAVQVWREDPDCAALLPSILDRKHQQQNRLNIRRTTLVKPVPTTAADRRATLENISKTVASALEELDDLDLDF